MHRISYIEIQNFRACLSVSLPLDDFTPLVGQNNVGKSTILDALKWLLKPDARSSGDFADVKKPIVVTACIEGITAAILGLIPEQKHRTAIEPYCPNGVLWIRGVTDGTTAKSLKQEVWDPAVVEANGSGAQRAIEMALIRYLAGVTAAAESNCVRKLLLIDEPELYLHPQGVRRVRQALAILATKGFQVVFSTHSPLMLDRANAAHTVIVRKEAAAGAVTRKPLQQAVKDALAGAESQSRALFELGNVADIYFAERVVICEGKTDRRILPLAYERLYGRAPELDHIAFISLGGCGDIIRGLLVLRAMQIPCCAIADLDFSFTEAAKGDAPLLAKGGEEMLRVKAILKRIQPVHGFLLEGDLPRKGKSFSAADIWGLLAADIEGKTLASDVHNQFRGHSIWIWKSGCIEHVTGTADKGEDAIIEQEEALRTKSSTDVAAEFPAIVECFEWVKSFDKKSDLGEKT